MLNAQTVWIACHIYRSCRKAALCFEAPALNSVSLPIVPQRASCSVRPCSVEVRVAFSAPQGTLGQVVISILVRDFPQIFRYCLALRRSLVLSVIAVLGNASESIFERGDKLRSPSVFTESEHSSYLDINRLKAEGWVSWPCDLSNFAPASQSDHFTFPI